MERRRRRRGEATVVTATVALATALLMVQGVVGEATSNPLRTSHFTLDQYSPSPPYHHGLFGFYERRSNNDGSSDENNYQRRQQQEQQQQQQQQQRQRKRQQEQQGLQQRQYLFNRKFEDDSIIYRSIDNRHNRRSSIVSISANDYPIRMKAHDKDSTGATISRDSSGMNVPQYDKERRKNFAGTKEFDENKSSNDYLSPPSEMDEPFVADETFKDEGPGSLEIYKLDLFEEKKARTSPTSNAKGVMVGSFLTGSLPSSPTSAATPSATSVTMRTSNNKSKVPKKSSRLGWKLGKSSNGSFKSTTITSTTTTTTSGSSGYDDGSGNRSNKDGKDLHGRSNFLDSELRSEVPTSVEAFGVGGVPELQVGCEGLEAGGASPFSSSFSSSSSYSSFSSSPSSLKLKRSVENTNTGKGKVDPPAPLNVVPISLNLDYDLSAESYEEMDELFKLKKLENEPKRNKGNRGDIDATLDDFLIQDRNVKEKLPVRGDLGNWSEPIVVVESIKRDNDLKVRKERSTGSGHTGTSGYVSSFKGPSRKLLWHDADNEERESRESGLWGYGEDEGVVSSDELDTEQRRRHRVEHRRGENELEAGDNVNAQIDKIREDYERSLERQRRKEEEILRRFREQEAGRSTSRNFRLEEEERRKFYEDRIRMEELRRREEARRREQDELRRRNLIPEDRRDFDNRRREWMEKRRLVEKEKEEEERRRKQIEEDRKRYEDMQRRRVDSIPSNWIRPYNRTRNITREEEERNRAAQRQRYDDERRRQMLEEERRRHREKEEERRRTEMERSRSRENAMPNDRKEQEFRRRMEERRRENDEERKLADYVRRNQPVEVRPDWQRRNEWNVSQRWKEGQEQRKAIEAARQMNRSNRYPPLGSGYERRQHGPFAPTYVDPRVSLDEARRRQEVEALQQRRQQEEEQRRRILEEERRREIDQRKAQSRRYEEVRKRLEQIRLEEERRKQEELEDQRRRSGSSVRVRPNPVTSAPASLIDRREIERAREQQRIREEQERKRQEIMVRQNVRQQHENSAKTQWDRENYRRVMTEQHRRQEEARLNALPVSASIIVRTEGSSSYPTFNSRGQFIYPDQSSKRIKMAQYPSISRKTTNGPNPCVWAVVQCCPTNANRLVNCFESLGCPGVNWDPNPCRADIEDAARDEVMRYYSSAQEEQNRQ